MFRGLKSRIESFNEYRRVHRQLSQLSARELADIGLTRADIETVARGRAL